MSAARGGFAVVTPSIYGPRVSFRDSFKEVAALLMAWARAGCDCKADTVWLRKRGKWVPAFPYQHLGGV